MSKTVISNPLKTKRDAWRHGDVYVRMLEREAKHHHKALSSTGLEKGDRCHVTGPFCTGVTKATCFVCGLPVCLKCSSRRNFTSEYPIEHHSFGWWSYGRVRMCNHCQEKRDGHDRIIRRRMRLLGGYLAKEDVRAFIKRIKAKISGGWEKNHLAMRTTRRKAQQSGLL